MSVDVALLLVAVLAVVAAAVLVAGEAALARVSRSSVEDSRRENGGRRSLDVVIDDRARYVNALLFGHTGLATVATGLVTLVCVRTLPWPAAGAVALAVGVMFLVVFVFLGVAPRTLGRQHPLAIASATAGVARVLAVSLGPLINVLILLGNAVTPGRGYREGPFASQAELRELVDRAEADQVIESDERRMIHSVFELGDTIVREVMVPRTEMVVVERGTPLRTAVSLALRSGFSRIPVVGEDVDDVVGLVYLKDATRRLFDDDNSGRYDDDPVESLMRAVHFVPDSKQADDLLREMQAARVHMAVVIDEYGGTAGLVTIEDILEEIVGEITDEYDDERPEVERLAGGALRVSSRMHVERFGELTGLELDAEHDGVDTVGGLLAKRLGMVPIAGAEVDVQGWTVRAESGAGRRNRIATVVATPPAAPEQGTTARHDEERRDEQERADV